MVGSGFNWLLASRNLLCQRPQPPGYRGFEATQHFLLEPVGEDRNQQLASEFLIRELAKEILPQSAQSGPIHSGQLLQFFAEIDFHVAPDRRQKSDFRQQSISALVGLRVKRNGG
jgi:hypothetical protein